MKCWRLKITYPNGMYSVEYYSLLRFALAIMYIWERQLNCTCSLQYGYWRA